MSDSYQEFMRKAAIWYWQQTLFEAHFNMTHAAARAQVNRTHMYFLLRKLGLQRFRRQHCSHRGNWSDFDL